jgi:EmrB/QacA subfamily drug resistance transporter
MMLARAAASRQDKGMTEKPGKPPKAPKGQGGKAKQRRDDKLPAPAETRALTHAEARTVVIGLMLTMFLGALDQTIVATALPTMGRFFNDIENLSWVVTAYLLTATASTPLYGKLSDIYGRRAVMLTAIAIFIAGSVACAMATSMTALILGRALQGLGGGGLMSMTQTIVADIVTPKERGRYQGYIGAVFASSSVGGPVLGGVLTEHLSWTLIFWINLPLGLVALALTSSVLRRLPLNQRRHALDLPGAALMVSAAIALMLALTWGGVRFPWLSWQVLGLFAGSAALWGLFSWRLATAPEPFLPLSVLANPIVRTATLSGACCMGVLVGLTIFIPLYFEVIVHLSASQSGLALIPLMGTSVISATLTGQMMARVEHYKRMAFAGFVIAILGLPMPGMIAILAVIGFGVGAVFPVTTVAMQNAVSGRHMGIATGSLNFFRSLGSALTVALLGAIVLGGIGASGGVSVEALARTASEPALVYAFRFVFLAAMLILCFGLAFLIGMEEKPLRGPAKDNPPTDLGHG